MAYQVIVVPDNPVIQTQRLILRLFSLEDTTQLEQYADNKDILATTSPSEVPRQGKIEEWIKIRHERYEKEQGIDFAVIHRVQERIIGAIGLGIEYKNDESMQLGYWIGKEYWNRGYCTEAAKEVLKYGFTVLGLHRIFSRAFTNNPASGRVRSETRRNDVDRDIDWRARRSVHDLSSREGSN